MTGRKIRVKNVAIKDGKLVRVTRYHSVSARLAAKKNPKRKWTAAK